MILFISILSFYTIIYIFIDVEFILIFEIFFLFEYINIICLAEKVYTFPGALRWYSVSHLGFVCEFGGEERALEGRK
jgi:hypothetical protein